MGQNEMTWNEHEKWNETKWNEIKWTWKMKWNEMKMKNEMTWNENEKWNENENKTKTNERKGKERKDNLTRWNVKGMKWTKRLYTELGRTEMKK